MKLKFFLKTLAIWIVFSYSIHSQAKNPDSLERASKTGSIEMQLKALSELTLHYQNNDTPKALSFALKQKQLAELKKQPFWIADALENLGIIYYYENNIDSALYYFKESRNRWEQMGNRRKLASAWMNISSAQRFQMQYDSALFYLQKALAYFDKEKDEENTSQVLANIAAIYSDMGNHQKHDEYALKALTIQERIGSELSLGITLVNLCISADMQGRYKEAAVYGERAVKVFRKINQPFYTAAALIRTASTLFHNNDKRGVGHTAEAMEIADKIDNDHLKSEALRTRADYYLTTGQWRNAKDDAIEALAFADTSNKGDLIFLYNYLIKTSIHTNEKEDAIKYLEKYQNAKDEIQQQEWVAKLSEMSIKYETEKKEMQIASMKEEKQLYIGLGIAVGAILLLTLFIFIIRQQLAVNRRKVIQQQKELAEQQVKQLEQEKQLVATQAVLDGETAERTRLAKDLHDGLGGMLSAVKLNLYDVKKGVVIEGEDITRFDQALTMLNESIRELRRVAHNMMPDSLSRYGLKVSLTDFCNSVPYAEFHYFGGEERLDSKLEVMIYRTIHELVNNAMKHSGAGHIVVQLIREPERIAFTVQDNGRGFDIAAETDGTGLKNIHARVGSFNGQMSVWSEIGKGTEISVEFKL